LGGGILGFARGGQSSFFYLLGLTEVRLVCLVCRFWRSGLGAGLVWFGFGSVFGSVFIFGNEIGSSFLVYTPLFFFSFKMKDDDTLERGGREGGKFVDDVRWWERKGD